MFMNSIFFLVPGSFTVFYGEVISVVQFYSPDIFH